MRKPWQDFWRSRVLWGCLVMVGGAVGWWGYLLWLGRNDPTDRPDLISSDQLQRTVVVPTLDTPLPPGKSAIWCSSFQLAWNEARDKLAGGPLRVRGAEEVCDRLNAASATGADLADDSWYANAGWVKDGIVGRITADMAARFPDVALPELDAPGNAAVAFAYLRAGVRFESPYGRNTNPLLFPADPDGRMSRVGSFGFYSYEHGGEPARKQGDVLYAGGAYERPDEFVVDLSRSTRPYQLLLARVDCGATLAETVQDLEAKMKTDWPSKWDSRDMRRIGPGDEIFVPEMRWRISHRLHALEGQDKPFENEQLKGLYIGRAEQLIDFHLDRSGAGVESRAAVMAKGGPRIFRFERPFLIVLRKRGTDRPFLVMWVANAELMRPFGASDPSQEADR